MYSNKLFVLKIAIIVKTVKLRVHNASISFLLRWQLKICIHKILFISLLVSSCKNNYTVMLKWRLLIKNEVVSIFNKWSHSWNRTDMRKYSFVITVFSRKCQSLCRKLMIKICSTNDNIMNWHYSLHQILLIIHWSIVNIKTRKILRQVTLFK